MIYTHKDRSLDCLCSLFQHWDHSKGHHPHICIVVNKSVLVTIDIRRLKYGGTGKGIQNCFFTQCLTGKEYDVS